MTYKGCFCTVRSEPLLVASTMYQSCAIHGARIVVSNNNKQTRGWGGSVCVCGGGGGGGGGMGEDWSGSQKLKMPYCKKSHDVIHII